MDDQEFSKRVRLLRDRLWRISYSILRNGADCDDAMQEALLRAWRSIRTLKDDELFSTWLTRILIRECNRIAASHARKTCTLSNDMLAEAGADNAYLRDAIFTLEPKLRTPLVLYYMEGYSAREIAYMLALPITTVSWYLRQAKSRLRDELTKEGNKS